MTKEAANRIHDLVQAIWQAHDKPERWVALDEVHTQLPDKEFYKVFVGVWTNSESNHLNLPLIDRLIDVRSVRGARVMPSLDAKERKHYRELPPEVLVFRGTTLEEPYTDYSWTTDSEKALWFARRCSRATPALATGLVAKEDILFTYLGRGESEVAVQTDKVRGIDLTQAGAYKVDKQLELYQIAQTGGLSEPVVMLQMRVLGGMPPAELDGMVQKQIDYLRGLGFVAKPKEMEETLEKFRALDHETLQKQAYEFARGTQISL